AADENVGAEAGGDRHLAARAEIIAGEKGGAGRRDAVREHRPYHHAAAGGTDIEPELADRSSPIGVAPRRSILRKIARVMSSCRRSAGCAGKLPPRPRSWWRRKCGTRDRNRTAYPAPPPRPRPPPARGPRPRRYRAYGRSAGSCPWCRRTTDRRRTRPRAWGTGCRAPD